MKREQFDHDTTEVLVGSGISVSYSRRWSDGIEIEPTSITLKHNGRPLVVIDPDDREQVERLVKACPADWNFEQDAETLRECIDGMQAALREFANPTPPKPYRDHDGPMAPWPDVSECHSSRISDHECPQCAWEHEHDWVAWNRVGNRADVPIRCSKCGGRKCDRDDCAQRRHTHTHHDEVDR